MEEGFTEATSDNLPTIDVYTLIDCVTSNPLLNVKVKGKSMAMSVKEHCQDDGIEYVQLMRENSKCTLKCQVVTRAAVSPCTLIYDEDKENIDNITCHECSANRACGHALAFLIWLFRRSQEPETSAFKSYWSKPGPSAEPTKTFITAKELYIEETGDTELDDVPEIKPNLLVAFINECKKRKNYSSPIMKYYAVRPEMKVSLHHLLCDMKENNDHISMDTFIAYCKQNITLELCEMVEQATRDGRDTELRYEVQYGRIMDCIIYSIITLKTNSVLVEDILYGYQYEHPLPTVEENRIKDAIARVVENLQKIKLVKSGIILSDNYPTIGATPYGLTEEHVVDIVYPVPRGENFVTSERFDKHEMQVQIQMFLAKKTEALLCIAYDDFETTKTVEIFKFHFKEDTCEKILQNCHLFWTKVYVAMMEN